MGRALSERLTSTPEVSRTAADPVAATGGARTWAELSASDLLDAMGRHDAARAERTALAARVVARTAEAARDHGIRASAAWSLERRGRHHRRVW